VGDVEVDMLNRLTQAEYEAVKMPMASLLSYHNAVRPEHVPALHW